MEDLTMEEIMEEIEERTAEKIKRKYGLTNREVTVLKLLAKGKTNVEIAEELFISKKTVINHIQNILFKMNVKTKMRVPMIFFKEVVKEKYEFEETFDLILEKLHQLKESIKDKITLKEMILLNEIMFTLVDNITPREDVHPSREVKYSLKQKSVSGA